MMTSPSEFALSLSLFAGVGVNLYGASNFYFKPKTSAEDIGLDLSKLGDEQAEATKLLMRLAGICLVALAIFYFVTALGPIEQAWSVVAAVLARLSGVVFYATALAKAGGPPAFKKYLIINLTLAIVPAVCFVLCGGLEALQSSWSNFYWVKS